MKLKLILSLFVFAVFSASVTAQTSPIGTWKTIDDETGEAKSHVEIYEQNGMLFGKVVKLLQRAPDTLCEKCPGAKKNTPVMGLVIIENLKPFKDYWKKGNILDPENGNEYGCSIWFEAGKVEELKVRGKHWTGLYRTQTWYKVKS